MITNNNKVTIFGQEVTFTPEQAAELKSKGYEFETPLFQLICRENGINTLNKLTNEQCVAAVFDSVKAHENVMRSSFIALAKEGLL